MREKLRWYHGLFGIWVLVAVTLFLWPRPEPTLEDEPQHLCSELRYGGYGYFEFGVDTRNIHFDRQKMTLTDSRTGFCASDFQLLALCRRCECRTIDEDAALAVVQLCDVVFVVGRDFRILSIMSTGAFEARGTQILSDIRTSIGASQ
jgi:hypothetical protein